MEFIHLQQNIGLEKSEYRRFSNFSNHIQLILRGLRRPTGALSSKTTQMLQRKFENKAYHITISTLQNFETSKFESLRFESVNFEISNFEI